ncbi:MAG: zinc transporter ZntB [Gammaproteobacteria bacterium]|nr:zinc transporter ZntB [Gammaproteobacteria bacterium]
MPDGLIFGSRLDGAGGGEPLNAPPAPTDPDHRVYWVHLDYQDDAARQWLAASGLEQLAVDALLDEDSRPRSLELESGLLVNLRGVNLNQGAQAEDMVGVRIWMDTTRIITTRRRQVRSPRELYERLSQGTGPRNPGDFLVGIVTRLNSYIETVIDAVEADISAAENLYGSSENPHYRGEFGALRRKTARLRRYLAPQRDTLERLGRTETGLLTLAQRNALREEADTMTRFLEDIDLSRERATVAQEELLNTMAQKQNERMYVLSIVAAVFLPLSFLTGLFGMNVAGLPGLVNPAAFTLTVLLMLACGFGIWMYFRWKKWL